jgi:hypothetical protein|tara:strand:- start:863 stop:1333 length:471 start_codon:yes stop_codon:yes gene_type:complete
MGAANIFTIGMGAIQYNAQGKIGKFNQNVANRNAIVLENQAKQIEQKAEFDVAQFNKTFRKLEGKTRVALAKAGAEIGSGSAYNIALSNAYEAELQKQLIRYNAKVASDNKREEAIFATIKGQIARNQATLAQIGTIASTGTSLLQMNQGSGVKTT